MSNDNSIGTHIDNNHLCIKGDGAICNCQNGTCARNDPNPFAGYSDPFAGVWVSKGWECPRCNVINAPTLFQCWCKPSEPEDTITTTSTKDAVVIPSPWLDGVLVKFREKLSDPLWNLMPEAVDTLEIELKEILTQQ